MPFFMKTKFLLISLLLIIFTSCKYNKTKSGEENHSSESTETTEWNEEHIFNLFTENEGLYAQADLDLLNDKDFKLRMKNLTDDNYDNIIENFNTETPIVSDNEVYKFTGCKQHDCPSFFTTVLYDAKTRNMNILVSENGKVKIYEENGKITLTKALRAK